MTDAPTQPDRRILAIVLAITAAGALGFAAFSRKWLYNPRTISAEEVSFGPLGNTICTGDYDGAKRCESMSNGKLVEVWQHIVEDARQRAGKVPDNEQTQAFFMQLSDTLKAPSAFAPFGWIAFFSCLIASVSILVATALVAAKKRLVLPIMPTTTAILGLMIGLVGGCVFVALKPGPAGYVGVNLGFFAFGGGAVLGIAASLMLNRLLRPHDPDLLADSMDPDHY